MSDYESRLEDARRERYEQEHDDDECLSGDPYCARNPRSAGTYEAYSGIICGACEDAIEQDERDRNTVPAGVE